MKQKTLDTLAAILKGTRPAPSESPDVWGKWADTVREVAAAAPTVLQEIKFLRDSGHSA